MLDPAASRKEPCAPSGGEGECGRASAEGASEEGTWARGLFLPSRAAGRDSMCKRAQLSQTSTQTARVGGAIAPSEFPEL